MKAPRARCSDAPCRTDARAEVRAYARSARAGAAGHSGVLASARRTRPFDDHIPELLYLHRLWGEIRRLQPRSDSTSGRRATRHRDRQRAAPRSAAVQHGDELECGWRPLYVLAGLGLDCPSVVSQTLLEARHRYRTACRRSAPAQSRRDETHTDQGYGARRVGHQGRCYSEPQRPH